jgi:hypothetical protein
MQDFNNSYIKQPFVTAPRTPFESLLGKNKISYFESNLFSDNAKKYFNSLYFLNTSLNFQFYDFPFLMALKSDSSRYM